MAEDQHAPRIGLLAGEPSGDNLGAGLMRELKRLHPRATFVGVGGAGMLSEGLEALHAMERLSVNGFVDPILRLPELVGLLRKLRDQMVQRQVDAFVGVDFNVFNLLLERLLKRRGIRTAHYVSPSVYAWRRGRAKRISRSADLLLTLYPFEPAFYSAYPVRAEYVGHPLAHAITDADAGPEARARARDELGLGEGPVVAVLPGSRRSEVALIGPTFLAAAQRMRAERPLQFVVPSPRPELEAQLSALMPAELAPHVVIHRGNARLPLQAADAALVKSGTSTLECMCLLRPMVVSYKLGGLSYALAKRVVRTPYVALPNILAGEALVPEYLQHDATPEVLAGALLELLDELGAEQRLRFIELRDALRVGEGDSVAAAAAVSELLLR